ncbi:MAG TPA: hypothetical protein VEQ60_14825 [Longimicrobium sp.]|nr:hypothetical protein [Longimicrobium sp.]
MMIRSAAFLLTSLFSISNLSAQETVQPYDASGRYRTGGLEAQLTGAFGGGRDVVFAWGVLAAGGPGGRWMQRTELAAGMHAGQRLVDRLMLGPQVSLGLAIPGWYTLLDPRTRAEPYLLLSAGAYGVADFENDAAEAGIAPTAGIGVGMRLFDDEWDISLTQVEVVVQRRFGIADGAPQLHLRLSRALPRRGGRAASTPHPDGPGTPPPPRNHR